MTSESERRDLYDRDFVQWTDDQAIALRRAKSAGANLPLDWDNLAEEIESLGKSQRAALRSQLRRILRHQFKLAASPAIEPRPGWKESIREARVEIDDLLKDSPSLRREIERLIAEQTLTAATLAAEDLRSHGESSDAVRARLEQGAFTVDQVLGNWFPDKEP